MSKALSITERQIVDGRQAAAMLQAAGGDCPSCGHDASLFESRVQQIVGEASSWFRTTGDKDPLTALRFIAALSEVKALHEELQHRVRKAEQAAERLNATAGD